MVSGCSTLVQFQAVLEIRALHWNLVISTLFTNITSFGVMSMYAEVYLFIYLTSERARLKSTRTRKHS